MVIKWSNSAIEDLHEFHNISKISNIESYLNDLINNVNLLLDNPKLGKIYTYVNKYIIRQIIHKDHKILYYIQEDTIHIVAVVYYKQDIKEKITFIKKYIK